MLVAAAAAAAAAAALLQQTLLPLGFGSSVAGSGEVVMVGTNSLSLTFSRLDCPFMCYRVPPHDRATGSALLRS